MKKYRLTKITVKTREIISMPGNAVHEAESSICPVCHAPLSVSLPASKSSAAATSNEKPSAELPSARVSGNQEKQLKGDL